MFWNCKIWTWPKTILWLCQSWHDNYLLTRFSRAAIHLENAYCFKWPLSMSRINNNILNSQNGMRWSKYFPYVWIFYMSSKIEFIVKSGSSDSKHYWICIFLFLILFINTKHWSDMLLISIDLNEIQSCISFGKTGAFSLKVSCWKIKKMQEFSNSTNSLSYL